MLSVIMVKLVPASDVPLLQGAVQTFMLSMFGGVYFHFGSVGICHYSHNVPGTSNEAFGSDYYLNKHFDKTEFCYSKHLIDNSTLSTSNFT